jgi:rod shape-determining protein MreB
VLAVGEEAKQMIGRTPGNIVAIKPLQDGFIADFDVCASMLKYFFNKTLGTIGMFSKPRVIVCVPAGTTSVEERAVRQSTMQAGAKEVHIMEEPMAAAIGAGLPVQEPAGSMVVDIGGGTSEVAVISLNGIVASRSVRTGGDEFDQAIIAYIKRKFNLLIGERSAERIKIEVGTAYKLDEDLTLEVKGRNLINGLPKNAIISSEDVREALRESLEKIIEAVKETLERTPPELAADIIDRGITLTGGGAMLRGLDKLICAETGIDVYVAENPLDCVANGTGYVLDHMDTLKDVLQENNRTI